MSKSRFAHVNFERKSLIYAFLFSLKFLGIENCKHHANMRSSFKYRFKRKFVRVSVERKPNVNAFLFYGYN